MSRFEELQTELDAIAAEIWRAELHLGELREERRLVMRRARAEGMSLRDIADAVDVSHQTVATQTSGIKP